jgi:hypothetical protein
MLEPFFLNFSSSGSIGRSESGGSILRRVVFSLNEGFQQTGRM